MGLMVGWEAVGRRTLPAQVVKRNNHADGSLGKFKSHNRGGNWFQQRADFAGVCRRNEPPRRRVRAGFRISSDNHAPTFRIACCEICRDDLLLRDRVGRNCGGRLNVSIRCSGPAIPPPKLRLASRCRIGLCFPPDFVRARCPPATVLALILRLLCFLWLKN